MKYGDFNVMKDAATFAGRFGFLSREIFFEHLCPKSRARKYTNWDALVQNGIFYRSRGNASVLHLTKKGIAFAGSRSIRWRPHVYISHDTHVANVLYALSKTQLMTHGWTEAELKEAPGDALRLLGGKNIEKVPDLLVDLKADDRAIRIAIEIEASRKSRAKYDQIALAYAGATKVDLIMFFCEDHNVELQIIGAFDSAFLRKLQKQPITIMIDDFTKHRLGAAASLAGREFTIENLLLRALRLVRVANKSGRDESEIPVSPSIISEEGSA